MTLASEVLEMFRDIRSEDGIASSIARTGATTITPTIVLARSEGTAITTREAVVTADTQEILIEANDYGALGEPADGDEFTYSDNGDVVKAEARPPANSEKCFYRWRGGAVFRIHCKVTSRV